MLVNLKEMMAIAEAKKIAIGSFNTPNLESLQAVLGAAETLQLPVIIQFAQCHEDMMALKVIGPVMVAMAKAAEVAVCVHLDHGETLDYLKEALDMGFTSIMYDGSTLEYETNIAQTIEAVAMAKQVGASVEAELGSMGKRESGGGESQEADAMKIYTDPQQAKDFVTRTGIDALACSFGTTHGLYISKPQLDFNIVEAVREETGGIPVVMHGGSGVSREDFKSAIAAGVRKVNYFTYMDRAGADAVRQYLASLQEGQTSFLSTLIQVATNGMKEDVLQAMRMLAGRD